MEKAIYIKQVKGLQQTDKRQRATMQALGLRGIGSFVYRKDTRGIRGMLNQVQHLVEAGLTATVAREKAVGRVRTGRSGTGIKVKKA